MTNAQATTLTPEPGAALPALETSARQLNENMAGLHGQLRELLALAQEKLTALRSADADTLRSCAAREALVLQQVFRDEQERRASLARLAQCLPVPDEHRQSLEHIANLLPEPFSSALRARNAALREVATQLQEKNKLAARVAHNLQSHIRSVFAELAKANQESVVYGPKGQHEQRNVRSWLDAVG